ncbi:MAG: RNase adapter RapZ [Casimicrobium sp.]
MNAIAAFAKEAVPTGSDLRQLVLVLGVSGAGKNVALGALEDSGFSVMNNLPATLLVDALQSMLTTPTPQLAISVNAQHAGFTHSFLSAVTELAHRFPELLIRVLRLDADDATLTRRFAETRRKHPFASDQTTLLDAIAEERARIRSVAEDAFDIDTSATSAHVLRLRVREFARSLTQSDGNPLVVVSSFAYRHGIPADADLVFDARILPNPYYVSGLAQLTGRDQGVIDFLETQPETKKLVGAITEYLGQTLAAFAKDNRARVHVAIGCTGGQHRSVYIADTIEKFLGSSWRVLRHDREHPKQDTTLFAPAAR